MRVCLVGSGGREHALAVSLSRTAEVVVTPGNPGMSTGPGRADDRRRITVTETPAEHLEADLYVIGPEQPLVEGLADRLRGEGRLVFGPGADGARMEGSKAFMKEVLAEAGVPTARFGAFDHEEVGEAIWFLRSLEGPWVVKTDGLAAGKGVLVTEDLGEAEADVRAKLSGESFGEAGRRVVIEEGLVGEECSLLVVTDGTRVVPLAPAQDFKRLLDGDGGPNTGGMGAYSPVAAATDRLVDQILDEAVEPTLAALRRRGIDYRGVLYAGLMLTAEGPRILEYNVRFGDPETQVVLPRFEEDLTALLAEAASGRLRLQPRTSPGAAVCVVMAAEDYPASPRVGDRIDGLEAVALLPGVTAFHAGTRLDGEGAVVTAGGRVLGVTATGADLPTARDRAYQAAELISWEGAQYRTDIALAAARAAAPESTTGRNR